MMNWIPKGLSVYRAAAVLLCWVMTAAALAGGFPAQAAAEQNEGPAVSYEIHLLLDADLLLDEDHLLRKEYQEAFETGKDFKPFVAAYLETPDQAFRREGWASRVRYRTDKPDKGFRLTYKKRYPVPGGDADAAVRRAEADGFALTGEPWTGEIEWAYTGMTLSVSAENDIPAESLAHVMLGADRDWMSGMLTENMPPEERSALPGDGAAQTAELAGPVCFLRYTGTFLEQETDIEIWEIRDQASGGTRYITELSFEAADREEAAAIREKMIEGLSEMGLLLKEDSLKTQMILDAYFGKRTESGD